MNNKVVLFGIIGAVGCLIGWLLGEGLLLGLLSSSGDEQGQSASLVSKPEAPPALPEVKPPEPPPEMKKLVEDKGGEDGEVRISLMWKNHNDLDLVCIDPENSMISFQKKEAPSGGKLDVDENVGAPLTMKPVENIRWRNVTPPRGKYKVAVLFYTDRVGPCTFDVFVRNGNQSKLYKDLRVNTVKQLVTVCEFEYPPPPSLRISASPSITLNQGTNNSMMVRLAAEYCEKPIQFTATGLPAGVQLNPISVEPNQTEATLTFVADATAVVGTHKLKLTALTGSTSVEANVDLQVKRLVKAGGWSWWLIVVIALWTALLAVGLTLALVGGQNRYLGRPLVSTSQAMPILLGSAAAGAVAGAAGQIIFGLMSQVGVMPQLGFLAGWGLLGGLVGWGVCFFIPNLAANKSIVAGAIGGLMGALAFIAVTLVAGNMAGRFLGAAMLGAAIGLMVALVELAFRSAWLEVRQGIELRTVNLGPEPISLGSDASMNTIYVPYTEPRALKFWVDHARFYCEDMKTQQRREVRVGEEQQLGKVILTVRTSSKAPTPTAQPTIKAPPPPPGKKPAAGVPTPATPPAPVAPPLMTSKPVDTGNKLAPPPPPPGKPATAPPPSTVPKPANAPPLPPGVRQIKPPPPPPPRK